MTAAKLHPQLEKDPKDHAVEVADAYDLSNLRLDQSFVESAGVKRLLTSVPVRKPNPQDFIRVHPDPEYRAALAIIELRDGRETYLVAPSVARDLPGEFVMANVYTAINRQGVVQLWPVRLPAVDGRVLEWHRSAAEAAELAMQKWVRVNKPTCRSALTKYSRLLVRFLIPSGQNSHFKTCSASRSAIG